ncbi:MAG: 2-oxoglutarate dehydrogenase complex dihydrolipoyllysine-residue succinyltransferase [Litorivicinaceae bacterium]|nr:2-oxoglutarate dehydrogenase complex dihydrolipoyllysine-residue succinyltransferase [Litorivicinaceae bacterium]MDP5329560.1 2-oxoglutarate dehydrogenase complex dihydrolipoyllysine-residue succinyltransferase [Litorivicinaceae bacterium]MDP5331395.1 2-oxoglutarate dehydrogenase complex dihydrolipoyllysine-residue succinyltransferase [Litorivicinaceae bacterium]MDP5340096.1 2-oxoglutarate dehydrogenase complex dihydrolipoyllysine-residue succinyltransferase [Litorivicinaceae bacterium]MDP53
MTIEIKAPQFPESVEEGSIATWHKKAGDAVRRDELLVDIETDKTVLEVVASEDGVLSEVLKADGDTVLSQEVIGRISPGAAAVASSAPAAAAVAAVAVSSSESGAVNPAAKKLIEEHGLDVASVTGSGKDGRILKEDVLAHLKNQPIAAPVVATSPPPAIAVVPGERLEKRVPMTRLRATIAKRLLDAQHNAAMLTTFNEVNMKPLMTLRSQYKELFEKTHNGTRLGFMGFFVKAAAEALKRFPAVNASIDGNDIVYHGYYDIGVAVSTERGLVVPVLRDCDQMSIAEVEGGIRDFASAAKDGKLSMEDMTGGTFTITNGGVFGSLMSTPILNPPQTAILGMHKTQDRPMAVNGQVVILPMMYLALSYDHRMIDGKDAVQFLVAIKDMLEDPARMLLDV